MAGNDDIFAIGELMGERFPGFTPHENFVPSGGFAEEFHVFFDVKN